MAQQVGMDTVDTGVLHGGDITVGMDIIPIIIMAMDMATPVTADYTAITSDTVTDTWQGYTAEVIIVVAITIILTMSIPVTITEKGMIAEEVPA